MYQVALPREQAVDGVGQIPRNLVHPQTVRHRRDPGDFHSSRRQIDKEQHDKSLQSFRRPDLNSEEIGRHNQFPVLRQKFLPGLFANSLWCRRDAVPLQNVCDRAPSKFVSHI